LLGSFFLFSFRNIGDALMYLSLVISPAGPRSIP
jgi:hypothetical protein